MFYEKRNLIRPLFCKPSSSETKSLFENFYPLINGTISFKSFHAEEHLNTIHDWVNRSYTETFWQMSGSIGLLRSCYLCVQQILMPIHLLDIIIPILSVNLMFIECRQKNYPITFAAMRTIAVFTCLWLRT